MNTIGTFDNHNFSLDTISELVEDHNYVTTVLNITEILDGMNCSAKVTVELETGEVETIFIKISTFNKDAQFRCEPFILLLLREEGISVPKPLYYDYTQEDLKFDWYITEYVSKSDEDVCEYVSDVGKVLGQINSIELSDNGRASFTENTSGVPNNAQVNFEDESFINMVENDISLFASQAEYQFSNESELVVEHIDELIEEIEDIPQPKLLHLDYWWENVIIDSSCNVIPIDWHRTVSGDPLLNVCYSYYCLFHCVDSQVNFDEFIKSYVAFVDSISYSQERMCVYQLYPRLKEMRAFSYWWSDETDEWKDDRAEQLSSEVEQIISSREPINTSLTRYFS